MRIETWGEEIRMTGFYIWDYIYFVNASVLCRPMYEALTTFQREIATIGNPTALPRAAETFRRIPIKLKLERAVQSAKWHYNNTIINNCNLPNASNVLFAYTNTNYILILYDVVQCNEAGHTYVFRIRLLCCCEWWISFFIYAFKTIVCPHSNNGEHEIRVPDWLSVCLYACTIITVNMCFN